MPGCGKCSRKIMPAKKVLIVNPYWNTLGGGERYVASFAKLMLENNWQVDILWPSDLTSDLASRFGLKLAGANWLSSDYSPAFSAQYNLLFWVSDGSLPVSFAKKTFIHLQFPFRGVGGRSLPNLLKSRLYTFVVNSRFTKSFIDREFFVNSRVVYPPVDTRSFIPAKKEKIILYVGRFSNLTQSKGHQLLVNVFRDIYKKLPGWKLILAGGVSVGLDDLYMRQLRETSRGLPVTIITDPKFSDLTALFSRASIFWSASGFGFDENKSPTKVEHFGISVVEAMSAGAVPIVTNLGGFKEIVDHTRDGFLWSTLREFQNFTLQIATSSQLPSLSQMAVNKSRIFSIPEFNHSFMKLIHGI